MYQKLSASDWEQIRKELSDLCVYSYFTIPLTKDVSETWKNTEERSKILELDIDKYTVVNIQKTHQNRLIPEKEFEKLPCSLLFFVETKFNTGASIDLKKSESFSKKAVAKTPIQELFEIIETAQWPQQLIKELLLNRKQLLKREKNLITTSYDNGQLHYAQRIRKSGEEYYEENFNNQ